MTEDHSRSEPIGTERSKTGISYINIFYIFLFFLALSLLAIILTIALSEDKEGQIRDCQDKGGSLVLNDDGWLVSCIIVHPDSSNVQIIVQD